MTNPYARKNAPRKAKPVVVSEDAIQIQIMEWSKLIKHGDYTLFDFFHHSPNGGIRTASAGAKFKKAGTKAGYPDLMLDIARNGYHGLRIELKRDKGGVTSSAQLERLKMLNSEGYHAVVCHGFDSAIAVIKQYMDI